MKITREKELAVRGLMQLTKSRLEDVEKFTAEIAALLDVPNDGESSDWQYFGHVSDAVYEKSKPEHLFEQLGIKLEIR